MERNISPSRYERSFHVGNFLWHFTLDLVQGDRHHRKDCCSAIFSPADQRLARQAKMEPSAFFVSLSMGMLAQVENQREGVTSFSKMRTVPSSVVLVRSSNFSRRGVSERLALK